MKIIHCADIHLNSPLKMALEKAEERRDEILKTFFEMLRYADSNSVDVVIIAGDLFDDNFAPDDNIVSSVLFKISSYPQIKFLYLAGNHEKENPFIKREDLPENLKFFSSNSWQSFEYEGVVFTGRDSLSDADFYDSLVLDTSKVNIVCLHGEVNLSATTIDDKALARSQINLKQLQNKGIDYLALGHLHSYAYGTLDQRGKYCYSGCLEGRGFDELGEKGFVLLEVNNLDIKHTFIPFAQRKIWGVIDVDVSGACSFNNICQIVQAKLDELRVENKDIIKNVCLVGDVKDGTDIESFCQQMEKCLEYYYIKFSNNTQIAIDYSEYTKEVSLRGAFVNLVLGSDKDEQTKAALISQGLRFITLEKRGN